MSYSSFSSDEHVAAQMKKMPDIIEAFRNKIHLKEERLLEQQAKHQALLDEARDFFGYNVEKNDPRFVQMQELKAEEEQKLRKKRRKEEKERKWQETLAKMAEEAAKRKQELKLTEEEDNEIRDKQS